MLDWYDQEEEALQEQLSAITDPSTEQYAAVMQRLMEIQRMKINYRNIDLEEAKENIRYSVESDKAENDKRRSKLEFWAKTIGVVAGVGLTVFGWYAEKTQIWITKAIDKASSAVKFGK